jgi:phosphonate transport system substrate-binding protein
MKPYFKQLCLLLACLCCAGALWAADCSDPKPFRFAVIPKKNVQAQLSEYRPMIAMLQQTLGRRIELVPASSYGAVVEGLLAGNIDLAELGPASYASSKARDPGITAFASTTQPQGLYTDSNLYYRSILVVRRKNNGPSSLAALRGASVSLIDPDSTSGALVPRDAMVQLTGVSLEHYFGRVTFAGSHDRAIQAVQKGLVDAAFVASLRLDEALRQGSLRADELEVVWQSAPLPHDPFVYRGALCPKLISQLNRVFFEENAALQPMFQSLGVASFVRVHDETYSDIRKIIARQP